MIRDFYEIGKIESNGLNKKEKIEKVLFEKMINPEKDKYSKDEKTYREIIMNFDTVNDTIEIKLGEELTDDKKEWFFAFESPGASARLFYATNNLYYFNTIMPDLLTYCGSNKNDIEFDNYDLFYNEISKLNEMFYVENKNLKKGKRILNVEKFVERQKNEITNYLAELNGANNYDKKLRSAIEKYVEKDIIQNMKIFDVSIFTLTINNKRINELEYFEEYKDLVFYNKFYKDMISQNYSQKVCGCCGKVKDVTAKVSFPIHFKVYMITGKNFFYGRSDNKSARYKTFSLCEDCNINIYLGMLSVINNFNYDFLGDFNMKYLMIPKNIYENSDFDKIINRISRMFSKSVTSIEEQREFLKQLKYYANRRNILFDMYFYELNSKKTGVRIEENIADVSYKFLVQICDEMNKLNEIHTTLKSKFDSNVDFNFAYNQIFKRKENTKYVLIKKEILEFFSSVLKGRCVSYRYLLRLYLLNYKGKYHDKRFKNNIVYSPFDMQLFITWLSKICGLRGGFMNKNDGVGFYEIEYPKIKEYFNVHNETFRNKHRQGLFFLGVLINEILKEQNDNSSTFMDKIKFEGLKTRDVRKLVIEVTKYLEMYRPYINGNRVSLFKLNRKIYGYVTDLLVDIDQSTLTKDENLFYILSGVSFAKNVNYKKIEESEKNVG